MAVDRTISFEIRRIADPLVTDINYVPDCVVVLWEGAQLLLAKVKDADGQDWYICIFGLRPGLLKNYFLIPNMLKNSFTFVST